MKEITLDVLASPGCAVCRAFEEFWHSIEKDFPNVKFRHIEVTGPEGQELALKYTIMASPGIILNGELFATGGFNRDDFIAKLKELSV